MVNKATFTPDEWTKVMESVMLTGMAVTAADPSGLIGVLKESMATGRNLLAARSDPESNELVRAVATDFATSEGRHVAREGLKKTLQGSKAGDVAARSMAKLREVVSLVDQKAPGDAAGFKIWLQHIAVGAAEAANEGGFLGFGGVQVSDAEKATLTELSTALGIQATAQATAEPGSQKAPPGETTGPSTSGEG
ncbi:MAG TPA: hypothetical protein VFZ16_17610 [Hyphomicrobiaceae bacterium]|nr:hypothetical protein [Hyphomicrobiaceae bacterium]